MISEITAAISVTKAAGIEAGIGAGIEGIDPTGIGIPAVWSRCRLRMSHQWSACTSTWRTSS
jgi:hypothetical protein